MKKNQTIILLIVAGLLLLQFYLRAHNALHLPFFVDEHRHIARAEVAFNDHPARNSMGKFLLYIWLAPFQGNKLDALIISRWAIAMWSLLGSATLFALTRKLFGWQAALYAVLFYALAPLSLFYERMVLADGFAGVFGVLVAWQSIHLAEKPTYSKAMRVGVLVALAIMAKLTLSFSALLPIFAIYLFGNHPHLPDASIWRTWWARTRRYWPYLFTAGVTCIVAWLPVLIPAAIVATRGEYYVLIDQSLADTNILNESDVNRYGYLWEQLALMLAEPMLVFLLGSTLILLWKAPPKALYGVLWLGTLWFPAVFLVWRTRTRYLAPSTFALALLVGGGIVTIQQILNSKKFTLVKQPLRNLSIIVLPILVMGVWMVSFAVPFAHQSMTDATALNVPTFDENDYYRGIQSAYELEEVLTEIDEQNTILENETVPVMGMFWMCTRFNNYFEYLSLELDCTHNRYPDKSDIEQWHEVYATVQAYAEAYEAFYLVVEDYRGMPFEVEDVIFILVGEYQRPKNGVWVSVWYACQADDINCQTIMSQ